MQMARKGVLVTSGPTRAWLDRVRYITNSSSGALGAAIVEQLVKRGFPVVHLSGESAVRPQVDRPELLESVPVATVDDLVREIRRASVRTDIAAVIHAMAVLDYIPEHPFKGKKKSDTDAWTIRLVKTPKVICMLRDLFPASLLVGFKLEAGVSEQELMSSAGALLAANNLDLVVANDIDRVSPDHHEALIIGPEGELVARPETKREIAETLAGIVAEKIGNE